MGLSALSIKSRLTRKFTHDVNDALAPLIRSQSYALDIETVVNEHSIETLNKVTANNLAKLGVGKDLPGLAIELHSKNLQDLVSLNARDEDLVPFVHHVKVTLTLDKHLEGPSSKIIVKTIEDTLNPLKSRATPDEINLKFEDLSAISISPADTIGASSSKISSLLASLRPSAGLSGDGVSQSPVLAAMILVLGLALITTFVWLSLRHLRKHLTNALDGLTALPASITESIKSLAKSMQATQAATQAAAKTAAAQTAKTATATPPPSPASASKPTDSPVTLEKHLMAKRRKLFENPQTLAGILSRTLKANKERTELSRFLKSLTPAETQKLSAYFTADELAALTKLALMASVKPDPAKLGLFLDKLASELSTEKMSSGPFQALGEILSKIQPPEILTLLANAKTPERLLLIAQFTPDTREKVFSLLETPLREEIIELIASGKKPDLAKIDLKPIIGELVRILIRNTNNLETVLDATASLRSLLTSKDYDELLRDAAAILMQTPKSPLPESTPTLAIVRTPEIKLAPELKSS